MSDTASQLQFTANLVTLLVAAAGLVLVALRSELTAHARWARSLAAAGFVAIATAAFVRGSLLTTGQFPGLAVTRLAGDAALFVATLGWRRDRLAGLALRAGLVVSAAAAVMQLSGSLATAIDITLIVGAAGVAVGLVVGGRHSVVARLTTAVAGSLLLVVLVVSVALSSVIAAASQRDALNALRGRAAMEGNHAINVTRSADEHARFIAADLAGFFQPVSPDPLVQLAGAGAPPAGSQAASQVTARLQVLAGLYPEPLAYVVAGGQQVLAQNGANASMLSTVARSGRVPRPTCPATAGRTALRIRSGRAMAMAAYPVCLTTSPTLLGTVWVGTPLDEAYLAQRQRIDPSISLALATPQAVLATAGHQPAPGVLRRLAGAANDTGRAATTVTGGRYLIAEPLVSGANTTGAGESSSAAVVLSSTGQSVLTTRERTDRTLFLIALGGTVIALLIVAGVGDRNTRGLRLLTEVADRVRRGGTGERAGITSTDEVGRLGATFNSMMGAVEAQTAALEVAAEDETRLRNRLQAVVAGMGEALVATDASGTVTEFNTAAEELTATAASEAIGQRVDQVLSLVDEEGVALSARLVLPAAGRWARTATLVCRGGEKVPVAVSGGPLRGPATEVSGSVLVLRDLRREQELDRMKSELLSRMGHELRTPLTGIMGYAEILLARDVPAPSAARWHEEILGSAKRLLRIVQLLEFFASAGGGRALLQLEPVDTPVLVRGIASAWAERVPPSHDLGRRVARNTPPVLADRRWLTLAIDELVDNAVKFSPEGGRIVLAAGRGPDGGVEISVIDRGVGMTSEQGAAAFGEFHQVDASDTRSFGGLGLGLSLVQRVVEGLNGSVSCESTPGGGSTFTLHLPAFQPTNGWRKRHAPTAVPPPGETVPKAAG